jgi:hypothetical protein
MRTMIVSVLCLAIGVGCGGAKFADEREELSYLSSLSNPTPEQWKRKKELEEQARSEQSAQEEAIQNDPAHVAARAKERADDIAKCVKDARFYEGKGAFMGAIGCWEAARDRYPDSPEAKEAPREIARLNELIRQKDIAAGYIKP